MCNLDLVFVLPCDCSFSCLELDIVKFIQIFLLLISCPRRNTFIDGFTFWALILTSWGDRTRSNLGTKQMELCFEVIGYNSPIIVGYINQLVIA